MVGVVQGLGGFYLGGDVGVIGFVDLSDHARSSIWFCGLASLVWGSG